jgi:hypothetical protein
VSIASKKTLVKQKITIFDAKAAFFDTSSCYQILLCCGMVACIRVVETALLPVLPQ